MALYLFPIDHLPTGFVDSGRDVRLFTTSNELAHPAGGWRLTDYPVKMWRGNIPDTYPWFSITASSTVPKKKTFLKAAGAYQYGGFILDSSLFVTPATKHFIVGLRISRYGVTQNGWMYTSVTPRSSPNVAHWGTYRHMTRYRKNAQLNDDRPFNVYREYHFVLDGSESKLHIHENGYRVSTEVLSTNALNALSARDFLMCFKTGPDNQYTCELSDLYVATDTPVVDPVMYPGIDDSNHTAPLGQVSYASVKLNANPGDFVSIDPNRSVDDVLEAGITSNQYPFQDYLYSEEIGPAMSFTVDYGEIPSERVIATHITAATSAEGLDGYTLVEADDVEIKRIDTSPGWGISNTLIQHAGYDATTNYRLSVVAVSEEDN